MFKRPHCREIIATEETAAKEYDEATWQAVSASLSAGAPPTPGALAYLDHATLGDVKRRIEKSVAADKQKEWQASRPSATRECCGIRGVDSSGRPRSAPLRSRTR